MADRSIRTLASALLLAVLFLGCSKKEGPPADSLWLVMKNSTGQHLTLFVLDHQTGKIEYEIFSQNYTFGEWVEVKAELPVRIEFFDEEGIKHERHLKRPLIPALVGGRYRVEILEDFSIDLSATWPEQN